MPKKQRGAPFVSLKPSCYGMLVNKAPGVAPASASTLREMKRLRPARDSAKTIVFEIEEPFRMVERLFAPGYDDRLRAEGSLRHRLPLVEDAVYARSADLNTPGDLGLLGVLRKCARWAHSDMRVLIVCRHCDLVHIDEQPSRLDLLSLTRH